MPSFILNSKLYDTLRWVVQIVLPAFATLYLALATQWDLPRPEAVAATVTAITAFLGIILGISRVNYQGDPSRFAGVTYVAEDDGELKRVFNVTADHIDPNAKEVVFKVMDPQ